MIEAFLWLALNVYHEARGESDIGQQAVVHATINRSKRRGLSIKETVLQPYQFSWTHQKESYIPYDLNAFYKCMRNVRFATQAYDFTRGSTFYHATSIDPYWANSMQIRGTFGNHKFYVRK